MAADSTVQYVAFFIRYRNVDDLGWGNSSFRYDLASGKEIEEKSLYRDEW
jgi:squalene cyclase